MRVKLGDVLIEQKQRVGTFDASNLPLLGVSNERGLHRSSMPRIRDMSRYLTVDLNWFAYNPMRINVGSIGWARTPDQTGVISPDYVVFSCSEEIHPRLLFSFLKDRRGLQAINNATAGSVRERLYFDKLAKIEIPLPPPSEQRRLVARIDELVAKIDEVRPLQNEVDAEVRKLLLSAFFRIAHGAPTKPMRVVAPILRRPVIVDAEKSYPELGIRSFGKGTFHKPALSGLEIGRKRIFDIQPGDLLFSNVFAWEGAIAVATPEDAKRVGSHRYITCVPRSDLATSRFLCFYFLTDEGLEKIRAASPGGAGRNRTLGLAALEAIDVPVPPIADQHWFNALQVEIDALRSVRADALIDLDALLPSIIGSAFNGGLCRAEPVGFHLAVQPSQDEYTTRRASIACYIVDKLHGSSTFGRTQLMKGLYLAEAHLGMDLCGEYERQAAGPFDKSIYALEDVARKQRWFDLQETWTANGNPKIRYVPLTGLRQKSNEGVAILGSKREEFDRILALFEKRTTKEVEIVATLFAAWNDLILCHSSPTDDAIVDAVLNNWHPAKKSIAAERWHKTIHWMRSESLVPSGLGRVTHRLQ